MEPLWTPWRMPYIRGIKESSRCILCEEVLKEQRDPDLIIDRGRHAFVVMNLYPYAAGHLMIVPYRHAAELSDLTDEELCEATLLLQRAERTLETETGSARMCVGINIGRCAGAGVEGHLHIHLVPCPNAPTAEPPEPLPLTRERIRRAWAQV